MEQFRLLVENILTIARVWFESRGYGSSLFE